MGAAVVGRWWAVALRGLAGVLFGLAAFVLPGITLVGLVLLFGAYLLTDSIFALLAGSLGRSWLLVLEGAAGVGAGILTLAWPQITAVVLLFLVAAWAFVTGVVELMAAVRLRRVVRNEWLLVLGGVASIVFGVLLVVNPAAGLLTLVGLIGGYSLVFGALLLGLGFRLRGSRRAVQRV